MKTRVIFASLVLGLGLVTTKATAATTSLDDSPATTKPANTLLINGAEKQFASYVEQRMGRFARQNDWQNFLNVVALYNANPASVLNLSVSDRARFNDAVKGVTKELGRRKDAEASRWLNQADYTARMINFLWNANQNQPQAPEHE